MLGALRWVVDSSCLALKTHIFYIVVFLAAEAEEPVRMTHLMQAVRAEYIKLERPLTNAKIGGRI